MEIYMEHAVTSMTFTRVQGLQIHTLMRMMLMEKSFFPLMEVLHGATYISLTILFSGLPAILTTRTECMHLSFIRVLHLRSDKVDFGERIHY